MKIKNWFRKMIAGGCCAFALTFTFGGSTTALAVGNTVTSGGNESATEEAATNAEARLNTEMQKAVEGKKYTVKGGGTIDGKTIYNSGSKDTGYVNNTVFNELDAKGQEKFLTDMNTAADNVIKADKKSLQNGNPQSDMVTQKTKENWLTNLQKGDGMGSQLIRQVTSETKLDFAGAQQILKPFNGVTGKVMAVGAILLMSILGIVFVLDLSYIALPPFRMMCDTIGGDKAKGNGGADGPAFISYEAKSAIQECETSGKSDGGAKIVIFEYFKKRILMIIVLGICLAYLVNSQIYTFVGWILDLCQQMLGF